MEPVGGTSFLDNSGSRDTHPAVAAGWSHLHKPITVMVMGSLMSAAGSLLFLLRPSVASESWRSVASACLSIGLMFVVVGLVWVPVLKEKHRRKRFIQGAHAQDGNNAVIVSTLIMSTPVHVGPVMERTFEGVGRCKCSFWFAVAHDILGVFIMMVGAFGGLPIHDLFIYAGAIIIFLSLIWWVFWYTGNIDVPPEELEDDVGMIKLKNRGLGRAVRRVSGRLSSRIRSSFRRNRAAPATAEVSLATIYDTSMASFSSKEHVRETLSI